MAGPVIEPPAGGVPIKHWTRGVPVDDGAMRQLQDIARMPIVQPWVAAMPDVHKGIGATVGSVIPTKDAIIPAAVGVDIGCGMMAVRTSLTASDLPENLEGVRTNIEKGVPHGRTVGRGHKRDKGSWGLTPKRVDRVWRTLRDRYEAIAERHPKIRGAKTDVHLGTLGSGNHFVEVCLDEDQRVWCMLHSGSRGIGNRIGSYFIALAKQDMRGVIRNLPHKDLAYFEDGRKHFRDYVDAVDWAQEFAMKNRELMMAAVLDALKDSAGVPPFSTDKQAVNCHHNYVSREEHFGNNVWVTRKGAVRAREGDLGIIPGSMGARSFIVRGKGSADSFHSCSHGAGRVMSRTAAKKAFTVEQHARATEGVECRKDEGVLDETPGAYKDIDAVMAAQSDLVDVVHTLKQVVCVKG